MLKKLLKLGFYALPFILFEFNFTGTRAAVSVTPSAPHAIAAVKPHAKLAAFSTRKGNAQPGSVAMPAVAVPSERPSPQQVKAYVRTQAVQRGVDPALALWIVKHESSYNPRARGDGDASRGLWQISKIYHPEVTDDQAFSVRSSTDWSLGRIKDGKVNEWSSYRNCRTLYTNCPY